MYARLDSLTILQRTARSKHRGWPVEARSREDSSDRLTGCRRSQGGGAAMHLCHCQCLRLCRCRCQCRSSRSCSTTQMLHKARVHCVFWLPK